MICPKIMIKAIDKACDKIELPLELSEENVDNYVAVKEFWLFLKQMFENYFSGYEPLHGVNTTKKNRELLMLYFNTYLSLYKVFSLGWADINDGLKHLKTDIKKPGDALIYILCGEAKKATTNSSDKIDTLYRAWKKFTINNFIDESENNYRKLIKKTGNNLSDETIFTEMCLRLVSSSKSKIARQSVKEYEEARLSQGDGIATRLRRLR